MKFLVIANLFTTLFLGAAQEARPRLNSDQSKVANPDLIYVPDPGLRVDKASNPAASVDKARQVYLFFHDRSNPRPQKLVATSRDGLRFTPARQPTRQDSANNPRRVQLPDGLWRSFHLGMNGEMTSKISPNGIDFMWESDIRYTAKPADNNRVGYYDIFTDPKGGVVLLYIGDMGGLNNVRRAYSTDDGWTFKFDRGSVLGDGNDGGRGHSHVDPKSFLLPNGRRRLLTMKQGPRPPHPPHRKVGHIYSFTTRDGNTFTPDAVIRIRPEDFIQFNVYSLNDPVGVCLPDGRHRIYVCALIDEGGKGLRRAIVSATTRPRK